MQLWGPITLRAYLRSRWSLKQSCSLRWELSNSMSHATFTQGNQGDSRLLLVGNQIANLTPDPSFGPNLCFRCPNGMCDLILDIYVPRVFQWYKFFFSIHWVVAPTITLWKFGSPLRLQLPKWKLLWERESSFPHTFPSLLGFLLDPQPCKPLFWS